MKYTIGIIALFFSSLSAAENFSVPVVNLGGVVVNHATDIKNSKSISLTLLAPYGETVKWNISCDYQIKENGGAPAPSPSNPFVAKATVDKYMGFYGDAYTDQGFISPSGTIKSDMVLAFPEWPVAQTGSIQFDNFDSTGDLIITNCKAALVVGQNSRK